MSVHGVESHFSQKQREMGHPRSRTWVAIFGVVVIEIAMAITLIPWTDHKHIETTDFVNFYAAATIVRQGHGPELYRAETQDPVLQSILGRNVREYFLHPPFEAAILAPLSYLSIERAFVVWTLFNLALLALLPMLFADIVSFVERRPYLGLLGFVFPPVLTALTLGQDSIIVLFVMTAAYSLFSKDRPWLAGIVLSLATVKFQYVLILAVLLIFARKFRFVAGLALGCIILALISAMVTGPAGIVEYVKFVYAFNSHMGFGTLHPDLMVNLRGFLSGMGWRGPLQLYSGVGSAALIAVGIVCSRWARSAGQSKLLFALYIAIALAASPYAFFDDATILLLPLFLALDWALPRGKQSVAKLIAVCCAMMFLWPVVLMIAGGHYWWNSHIYLVFPLIVLFIGALVGSLAAGFSHHRTPVPAAVSM